MARLENRFSWSKSRDESFRECPRKYYFNYYGGWGGWEAGCDPRVRELYVLKNLKSRHMWIGEVVHHTIEELLKEYRVRQEFQLEWWLTRLTETMRQQFRDSRGGRYRENPKKFLGLYEHEYKANLSDARWVEVHEAARKGFINFANVAFPELCGSVPVAQWKIIETMEQYLFEGVPLWIKIDYSFEKDGTFMVVDWKTGKSVDVDNEIQLACYGLFVRDTLHYPTEKIRTLEFNVLTLSRKETPLLEARLDFVKHYIRNSIDGMKRKLADREKNLAREEDFPFTENEQTCRWCNFRKVCPKWS